ncbi:hypothetical protein [Paenibacillus odorifer]|uniref:hypothetical protein n=1 Tax=Paenibacillus odorifer TaxID=189426 RepID=UPI001595A33F|nr:hypothetical protein [Paenibacillus odorifer]
MREYPIFTQRIAGELMAKGLRLLRTEPHRTLDKLHVFIFEDSAQLRETLAMKKSNK